MSLRTLGAALALKARNARRRRQQSVGLSLLDRLVSNRLALFPFAHLEQPPASGRAGVTARLHPQGQHPAVARRANRQVSSPAGGLTHIPQTEPEMLFSCHLSTTRTSQPHPMGEQCPAPMSKCAGRDGWRRRLSARTARTRAQRATPPEPELNARHRPSSSRSGCAFKETSLVTMSTFGDEDFTANPFPGRHRRSRMDGRTVAGRGEGPR
jgi:hypothetical protein